MRYPSVKTLMLIKGIDEDKAKRVRRALEEYKSLGLINHILGGYGVEFIPAGKGENSPSIEYVNLGDTYDCTLLLINGLHYRVGSWGDIVEKGNYP